MTVDIIQETIWIKSGFLYSCAVIGGHCLGGKEGHINNNEYLARHRYSHSKVPVLPLIRAGATLDKRKENITKKL